MSYIYKGIVFIYCFFAFSIYNQAQLPLKGDWKTRVGIKSPSMIQDLTNKVLENPPYVTPTRTLTYKDYLNYYESFKKLTDYAPYAHYHFYNGDFSETQRVDLGYRTIYECILDSITDEAMRVVIIDDFLALGRNMYEHLDSFNVVRANEKKGGLKSIGDTLTLPVAMTMYAHLYYKYAGNPKYYPAHLYDKELARENYRKAFRMLVDNKIDPGDELEAFYVREYYLVCEDLYKSDKEKYYEQFLNDYLEIVGVCDNLLLPYVDGIKSQDAKYEDYLSKTYGEDSITNAPYGIKKIFPLTRANDTAHISSYYLDKLPIYIKDHEYMEKALYVMRELKADRTQAYYKYSKASYTIKPTYLNCLGRAFSSWEEENLEEMDAFCSLADSLAPDSLSKGLVHYYTAMEIPVRQVKMKRKGDGKIAPVDSSVYQKWDYEMTLATNYLSKMMELSGTFAKSSKIDQRVYPKMAAYRFYDIQRFIGRTKFETSYIKEANKYIRLYANQEELKEKEKTLSNDIAYINKVLKGGSQSNRIPMTADEHKYLNELYNAVSKIFSFDLAGYASVSFSRLTDAQKTNILNYEKYYDIYNTKYTGMTSQQKAQYNTYLQKKKIFK